MRRTYRKEFAPRIAAVIAAHAGKPFSELREALRNAFPMGVRKYWPYKVWLSEIRKQLKLKPSRTAVDDVPLFEGMS